MMSRQNRWNVPANIPFDNSIVFETDHLTFEDGRLIADEIALKHRDIDGVFAFTDLLATGILVGLKEHGFKIPEDISIIGFSNWFLTTITTPTLSTVDQPGFIMGEEAFRLLLEEINDIKKGNKSVNFYRLDKRSCQYFYVISVIYEILCAFLGKIIPLHYKIFKLKTMKNQ